MSMTILKKRTTDFRLKARLRQCSVGLAKKLGITSRTIRLFASAALSSAFTNIVFLPLLSIVIFVVYMAHYKFFSYDFFSEGLFGMKLFVLAMVVGLLIISLALFGSGVLIYAKRKGSDVAWYAIAIVAAFNGIFLSLIAIALFESSEGREFGFFVVLVTAYIAFHFAVFFFAKFKTKIMMFFALFFVTFGLLASQPELFSDLLGMGLRTFGVGGEIPIEITSDDGIVKGKLILLTPKYVYFNEEVTGVLTLQSLDKVNKIRHIIDPKK